MNNTKPRRPESVLIIVYSGDERVLLLKRSSPFDFWQSVTGSLEKGERAAHAARRELLEETGLCDESRLVDSGRQRRFTIDPRWRNRYAEDVTENTEYEWHYRLDKPCHVPIDRTEHSAYQWLAIDAAINLVWSWTNKEALKALRTELRSKP